MSMEDQEQQQAAAEAAIEFLTNAAEDRIDDDGDEVTGLHLTVTGDNDGVNVLFEDRPLGMGGSVSAALEAAFINACKRKLSDTHRQALALAFALSIDLEVVEAAGDHAADCLEDVDDEDYGDPGDSH